LGLTVIIRFGGIIHHIPPDGIIEQIGRRVIKIQAVVARIGIINEIIFHISAGMGGINEVVGDGIAFDGRGRIVKIKGIGVIAEGVVLDFGISMIGIDAIGGILDIAVFDDAVGIDAGIPKADAVPGA